MATEHEYINKIKGYQDYDSLINAMAPKERGQN